MTLTLGIITALKIASYFAASACTLWVYQLR